MTSPSASELQPSNRSVSYPRAFLLGIYAAAFEHGYVHVTPLPQADYPSLKAQFYRLRKRSDTANKSFITPEHYLCSLTPWEPGPDGRGRCSCIYNRMPDGAELPSIIAANGDVQPLHTAPASPSAPTPTPIGENPLAVAFPTQRDLPPDIDLTVNELDIDAYVRRMTKDATGEGDDA